MMEVKHIQGRERSLPIAILTGMRPAHWIKNGFVLAPLLYSMKFAEPLAWGLSLLATAAFCLLSSAIYLWNDVHDAASDSQNPQKAHRPIASGHLSKFAALVSAAVLLCLGMAMLWKCQSIAEQSPGPSAHYLLLWGAGYVVLNVFYTLVCKHVNLLDVICIALGFVLRAMAGAAALNVQISPWLVVCTFTICIYIAITKRRAELISLGLSASDTREVHKDYTLETLGRLQSVALSMSLMMYSIYCLAPATIKRFGSPNLIWTIPLVVFAMFRFDHTSHVMERGDVVRVLLGDKVLWLAGILFVALTVLMIKFGAHPSMQFLEVPSVEAT